MELDPATGGFESARWRSHLVVPGHVCIRCTGQYNSSDVLQELDGSLDDPSYIANLPPELRPRNQNVFPFSLGSASMQVNLMVRYLIAADWWPATSRQEYRFIAARTVASTIECQPHCSFRDRVARGDTSPPSYLRPAEPELPSSRSLPARLLTACRKWSTVLPWVHTADVPEEASPERIER